MAFPSLPNLIKNPKEINPIPKLGLIGDIRIDVLKAEDVTVDYDFSDRPVESGFDITDARIKKPTVIRVEGILSDTQLTPTALAGRFIDGQGFELETWQEKKDLLLQTADQEDVISFTLPLGYYPSMLIKSIRIEQRDDRTSAAFFILEAREVRRVSSEVTSVDPSQVPKELKDKETDSQKKAKKKSDRKKDGGAKAGDNVSPAKEKSWALQLVELVGG